jgi:hypothetical protein
VNADALIVAATPALVLVGSAIAYYGFTERGDPDPVPKVRRGESEYEPWGIPCRVRAYRIPGDGIRRSYKDAQHDTRQLMKIIDTEGSK